MLVEEISLFFILIYGLLLIIYVILISMGSFRVGGAGGADCDSLDESEGGAVD